MQNVPEFEGANENNVQGGRYPAQIWNTFMNPAHFNMPISDWEAPPAPVRPPARLYLPDNECLFYISGYTPQQQPAPTAPAGFRNAPEAPPTTPPPVTTPATAPPPVLVPQYSQVDGGNTIPPDVTDPAYPLNTAPIEYVVRSCGPS
jgi:membrane peptidoglycan carboxypeptidase